MPTPRHMLEAEVLSLPQQEREHLLDRLIASGSSVRYPLHAKAADELMEAVGHDKGRGDAGGLGFISPNRRAVSAVCSS